MNAPDKESTTVPRPAAPNSIHTFSVQPEFHDLRIDAYVARQFPGYSRSYFQRLIELGRITHNDAVVSKASALVAEGDTVGVTFPPHESRQVRPENCADVGVSIIFTHPDFFIINKPAGLMVHPPSHRIGDVTLVDWILANFEELRNVGDIERPGIVHRLDKDTSGLMIIPRTICAHNAFGAMFRDREIHKRYLAVVEGHPTEESTITFPLGRDPLHRNRMMHCLEGRLATTHCTVLHYGQEFSLVEARPVTGRTHQIRVHLSRSGFPLIGDVLYGRKSKLIERHALHATGLNFRYNGQEYTFTCEPPEDMQKLITHVKKNDA